MSEARRPAVSVVVPCHDAAAYLAETLAAILGQSWHDLEVLLVDDGSRDDPGAVVEAAADARIRFYRIEASGGPSRPRNRAIAESRGRYVFFCDADDVMRPGKLEKQVGELENHPELALVFTDFEVIDAQGAILNPSFLSEYRTLKRVMDAGLTAAGGLDRERLVRGLIRANFIGTSSVAVRRSVLDEVGCFDESLASSEDLDLWLRIARRFDCGFLDIKGHGYRKHPESLMQSGSARHPLARIEVLERQRAYATEARTRRVVRRQLAVNHVQAAYSLEMAENAGEARRHYLAALRLRPGGEAAWGLCKSLPVISTLMRRKHRRDAARRASGRAS